MAKENLGILISGSGTTMNEMLMAIQAGKINMDAACVIASKESAGGLVKADRLGVPVAVVNPNKFRGSDGIDEYALGMAINKVLTEHGATVVTQNGWLPKTPDVVIDQYRDAIFNQHPGPLPEFGGPQFYGRIVHATRLHVYDALGRRDPFTEASTHRVTSTIDGGALVGFIRVPIFENDRVETLQERVLPKEHELQIQLLDQISRGAVQEIRHTRAPLILPGEEPILRRAHARALEEFPRG